MRPSTSYATALPTLGTPARLALTTLLPVDFPSSSDYMEKARRDGDVLPDTEKVIVYLVPVINVQKDYTESCEKTATADDAAKYIGESKPVGGEYAVLQEWIKK